ncbi:MAG: FixH family protein [Kofleriaceae bacterium]
MSAGTKWILAVIGLLLGNVLAGVVLIAAAHHGASRVLPGYYDRAVHYDDQLDQAARNLALAWRIDVELHDGVATVIAHDAAGVPIEHAHVHLDGVERARTAREITGDLVATRAGEYRARLGGAGWVDLSITIDRGAERYVDQLAVQAR